MKMNLNSLKTGITRFAGRTSLLAKKHSPEILLVAGTVGFVASTVMACKATLKVEEIVDETKDTLDLIEKTKKEQPEEVYSEQDYKRDIAVTYVRTGAKFVRLYGPAITLGVGSLCCVLGAHGIMKKRNVALIGAYKAVEQSFIDYRKRVVEEFGEEKDREYRYGIRKEEVETVEPTENGKTKKVKKVVEKVDPNQHSQYARFFDESSPQWSKTPEYNLVFLKAQQNYANDLLKARGHVFLNEVYDMLGIPRSQAGAVVGWVLSKDDYADNYIDFGIYDNPDFVNGYERSILLDFNCTGVIYDKI